MGIVNCPRPISPWATGFLIANGIVVTVGHVFFDRNGQLRAPLEQCFCDTQGDRAGQRHYFKGDAMSFRPEAPTRSVSSADVPLSANQFIAIGRIVQAHVAAEVVVDGAKQVFDTPA